MGRRDDIRQLSGVCRYPVKSIDVIVYECKVAPRKLDISSLTESFSVRDFFYVTSRKENIL